MRTGISISLILAALAAPGCTQPPHEALEEIPKPRRSAPRTVAPRQSVEELKARTDQLLKQLGSEQYKEREAAQAEMEKLITIQPGFVLAHLLLADEAATDPEVKNRLREVVKPYKRWQLTPTILDAVPGILELLEKNTHKSMCTAMEGLQQIEFKQACGVMFRIILEDTHCVHRAIEYLIENSDTRVVEFFIDLLGRKQQYYRYPEFAEYALQRIGKKSIEPLVSVLNKADNEEVRRYAARVLARIGEEGRGVLIEIARTGQLQARQAALGGFREYKGFAPPVAPPLEVLLELIKDKDLKVSSSAVSLLSRFRDQEAVDALIRELDGTGNRAAAALALAQIRDRRATPALIKVLKDKSADVRYQAAWALSCIKDVRAAKPLIELLDDSFSEAVYMARCALVDLGIAAMPAMLESFKTARPSVRAPLASEVFYFFQEKEHTSLLVKALKDELPGVRSAAAGALGRLRAKGAIDALITSLKDENEYVRKSAAEALGSIGGKRAVKSLAAALSDKEWYVRVSVAEALGEIGDKDGVQALITALKDTESLVFKPLVVALGRIGDERAFKPLVELLKSTGAVDDLPKALAVTGGKKAIPHLIGLLNHDLSWIGTEAGRALVMLGETAAEPLLNAASSESPQARANALEALALLREEKAFVLIVQALKDTEEEVRETAARVISLYQDYRAVDALIEALEDESSDVREEVAASLGRIGDRRAVKPLIRALLEDNQALVRGNAAIALGILGDASAIGPLITALPEDYSSIRNEIIPALASFKDNRVVSALIKALDYEGNSTDAALSLAKIGDKRAIPVIINVYGRHDSRYRIVEALRKFRAPETVDFFLRVLELNISEWEDDKKQAILALGEIGDARATEPLRMLLTSDDVPLRMAAATALLRFNDKEAQRLLQEALCGKRLEEASSAAKALAQSPHPVALPWLIEVLGDDKASIGYDAAKALGELGDKSATKPLMNALRDENKWVRRSAAEALAKLKEKQAVDALIEILATDSDDYTRQAAHDALREITGQNFGWNYRAWRRWYENSKNR